MTVIPTTPSEKLAALLPAVVIESSSNKNGKGASKPAANIQDVKRKAISLLTTVYKTESEEQVAELESKIKDLLKMINPEEAQKQIGQLQKEQQEENHQEDNLIPAPSSTSAVKDTPPKTTTTSIASTSSTSPKPTTPRSINRISSYPPPPTTTRRPSVPIRTTLSAAATTKKSDSPKPTLRSISSISSSAPPLPPTRRPTPRTATTSTTTTTLASNNNKDDLSQHIGEIPKPMKQFFQRADIERDEVNKQASFLEHAMGHHNHNNRRGSWVRRRKSFDDDVPAMIDVCGISCSHKSSNSKGHPDDDLSSTCTERTTQSGSSWRDRIGRVVGIRHHRHPELAHANSSNLSTSDGSSTTNNSTTDSTNESMTNNINNKMVVDPLATTTEEEENEEDEEEGGEDRGLKEETPSNISTDTPTADEGGQPRRWGSRWSHRAPVAA
eukprot:scaffold695_cov113-Cylindrotheca_fusiformis.AAC.3